MSIEKKFFQKDRLTLLRPLLLRNPFCLSLRFITETGNVEYCHMKLIQNGAHS